MTQISFGVRAGSASVTRPLLVDRNRTQLRAVGLQDFACGEVLRFLDRDFGAFVEQDAGSQRQRLLRAVDDQHIGGLGLDAAPPREVIAHRFAQRREPCVIGYPGRA